MCAFCAQPVIPAVKDLYRTPSRLRGRRLVPGEGGLPDQAFARRGIVSQLGGAKMDH